MKRTIILSIFCCAASSAFAQALSQADAAKKVTMTVQQFQAAITFGAQMQQGQDAIGLANQQIKKAQGAQNVARNAFTKAVYDDVLKQLKVAKKSAPNAPAPVEHAMPKPHGAPVPLIMRKPVK